MRKIAVLTAIVISGSMIYRESILMNTNPDYLCGFRYEKPWYNNQCIAIATYLFFEEKQG